MIKAQRDSAIHFVKISTLHEGELFFEPECWFPLKICCSLLQRGFKAGGRCCYMFGFFFAIHEIQAFKSSDYCYMFGLLHVQLLHVQFFLCHTKNQSIQRFWLQSLGPPFIHSFLLIFSLFCFPFVSIRIRVIEAKNRSNERSFFPSRFGFFRLESSARWVEWL